MSSGLRLRNIGQVAGNTDSGKAAVIKIIHPPEPTPSSYQGYPDRNNTDSVQLHYSLNTSTSRMHEWATGATGWIMWLLPSILYPVWMQNNMADANSNPGLFPIQTNDQVDSKLLQASVGSLRQVYRSTTFDNISAEIYKSGMLFGAQMRGNIVTVDTYTSEIVKHYSNGADFHKTYGPEIMGTNNFVDIRKGQPNDTWITKVGGIQILKTGRTITQSSSITMLSPKSQAGPGKDGAFMVTKPSQPEMMYKSIPQANDDGGVRMNHLYACALEFVDPGNNLVLIPMTTDGSGDPKKIVRDLPWFDHTIGILGYEAGNTVSEGANIFNLKTVCGYECAPLPGSTLNPLASPSACPDSVALDWLAVFNHSCADMFPAIMNAKGAEKQIATVMKEADATTSQASENIKDAVPHSTDTVLPKPAKKKDMQNAAPQTAKSQPKRGNSTKKGRPAKPRPAKASNGRSKTSRNVPVIHIHQDVSKRAKTVRKDNKKQSKDISKLLKALKV